MISDIYWIATGLSPRVAIMARPRAGDWLEDEIINWARQGVNVAVSLLERDEVDDLGLQAEPEICKAHGIEFISFPIADRQTPADHAAALQLAGELSKRSEGIAIHCRAGIGRSSLMAAAVLVSAGSDPKQALHLIGEARGLQVPDTDQQRDWVMDL